jgi:hypothetical protein
MTAGKNRHNASAGFRIGLRLPDGMTTLCASLLSAAADLGTVLS